MNLDVQNEIWYVYLVYGTVPELMPRMAFRRAKHFRTDNKKIIRCPYCGNIFTTIEASEKVEIFCHSTKIEITRHEAIPCRTCRNVVGIIYSPVPSVS